MPEAISETKRRRVSPRTGKLITRCGTALMALMLLLILLGPYIGPLLWPRLAEFLNFVFRLALVAIVVLVVVQVTVLIARHIGAFWLTVLLVIVIFLPWPIPKYIAANFFGDGPEWKSATIEGVIWSSPHRIAIENDCLGKTMSRRSESEFHRHAYLHPPQAYAGTYVASVSAMAPEDAHGRISVLFGKVAGGNSSWPVAVRVIEPGDTIVFEGTCTSDGVSWAVTSSLPVLYRPAEDLFQWWPKPR